MQGDKRSCRKIKDGRIYWQDVPRFTEEDLSRQSLASAFREWHKTKITLITSLYQKWKSVLAILLIIGRLEVQVLHWQQYLKKLGLFYYIYYIYYVKNWSNTLYIEKPGSFLAFGSRVVTKKWNKLKPPETSPSHPETSQNQSLPLWNQQKLVLHSLKPAETSPSPTKTSLSSLCCHAVWVFVKVIPILFTRVFPAHALHFFTCKSQCEFSDCCGFGLFTWYKDKFYIHQFMQMLGHKVVDE